MPAIKVMSLNLNVGRRIPCYWLKGGNPSFYCDFGGFFRRDNGSAVQRSEKPSLGRLN